MIASAAFCLIDSRLYYTQAHAVSYKLMQSVWRTYLVGCNEESHQVIGDTVLLHLTSKCETGEYGTSGRVVNSVHLLQHRAHSLLALRQCDGALFRLLWSISKVQFVCMTGIL